MAAANRLAKQWKAKRDEEEEEGKGIESVGAGTSGDFLSVILRAREEGRVKMEEVFGSRSGNEQGDGKNESGARVIDD